MLLPNPLSSPYPCMTPCTRHWASSSTAMGTPSLAYACTSDVSGHTANSGFGLSLAFLWFSLCLLLPLLCLGIFVIVGRGGAVYFAFVYCFSSLFLLVPPLLSPCHSVFPHVLILLPLLCMWYAPRSAASLWGLFVTLLFAVLCCVLPCPGDWWCVVLSCSVWDPQSTMAVTDWNTNRTRLCECDERTTPRGVRTGRDCYQCSTDFG